MFLGKNRFKNQGGAPEEGGEGVGENTEFLNQAKNMPMGMQRFLTKRGINSSADLANRVQFAPRMPFRKVR
ncbi:MAG: hypothetical protein APF81_08790 [Desulfosporosinus sp. BRH_c37]|nr:MAG: hypothetical protein APF81_08790 [Desulfosporosinus sp. BRH_c37]